MALRALLFDVDGTLADTEPHGHLPAYNRAFKEMGLGWKWSKRLYRKLLLQPGGRERLDHYLKEHAPDLGPQRKRVEHDRHGWIEDVHRLKSKHFRRRLEKGRVPLRPGVRRLMLGAAESHLQIALVTNASRASLEPFLAHALGDELRSHIDAIVSGEDVERKKPAPDLYEHALEQLQLGPSECVALEDSEMGLQSASDAGIATLVVVNDDTRRQRFDRAVLVVDSLGEPDAPGTVLRGQGEAPETCCVDVAFLQRLIEDHDADDGQTAVGAVHYQGV